jgi:hypothetical protein
MTLDQQIRKKIILLKKKEKENHLTFLNSSKSESLKTGYLASSILKPGSLLQEVVAFQMLMLLQGLKHMLCKNVFYGWVR